MVLTLCLCEFYLCWFCEDFVVGDVISDDNVFICDRLLDCVGLVLDAVNVSWVWGYRENVRHDLEVDAVLP